MLLPPCHERHASHVHVVALIILALFGRYTVRYYRQGICHTCSHQHELTVVTCEDQDSASCCHWSCMARKPFCHTQSSSHRGEQCQSKILCPRRSGRARPSKVGAATLFRANVPDHAKLGCPLVVFRLTSPSALKRDGSARRSPLRAY